MTTIETELAQLRSEFDNLPDGFARYSYLVELAALLPDIPEELRREENLYRGCQSRVWLAVSAEHGTVRLNVDSDTLLIRGLLYLFRDLLDGRTVDEVLSARFDLLQELPLAEHFNSRRTAGIAGLLGEIQRRLKNGL